MGEADRRYRSTDQHFLGDDRHPHPVSIVVDPGDNILCRVTATDADGGTAQGTDTVSIDNSDPVVTDVQIRPDTNVTTSTTLTCTATATDPDGGTPSLSYQWAKQTGGTGALTNISSATTDTLTLSASVVQPGDNILCRVTATDADGGSAQGTDTVSIENSAPTVTDVQISPDTSVTTSTTLTCTATATDPDGGTPTLSYEWAKQTGGTGTATNISSATTNTLTLSPSVVQPGDSILCRVTATDSSGDTDQGTDSVTVTNSRPVVTSVEVTPDTGVTTSTTLTCSATANDPDGGTPTLSTSGPNKRVVREP